MTTKLRVDFILYFFILLFTSGGINAQTSDKTDEEKELLRYKKEDTVKVNMLNRVAYSIYSSNPTKAKEYAREAVDISKKRNYPEGKAEGLWLEGLTMIPNDREGALSMFSEALSIAEKVNDRKGICNYLTAIGTISKSMGDMEKSSECYRKAIQIAEQIKNNELITKTLLNYALLESTLGNNDNAIKHLTKALNTARKGKDETMIARLYASLANLYKYKGNHPLALEYYLSALSINEKTNNNNGTVANLINIAGVHIDQEEFDNAINTVQKALDISKKINDSVSISICYTNMGYIYSTINRPEALDYFIKSLNISRNINIKQKANTLMNIGSIYTKRGEFKEAWDNLSEALLLARKVNIKNIEGEILIKLGNLYFAMKNYAKAIEYADSSVAIAKNISYTELKRDCYKLFSEVYYEKGKYKEAYDTNLKYESLSDSVINEKNIKKIANLETSYKYEKQKQKYEIEKTRRESHIKLQRHIIIFFVIIAIMALGLAFTIYWTNRLKKRVLRLKIENINRELESNQKAMTGATLQLIQTAEKNDYYIKKLENLETICSEEARKDIRSLISDYKLNTSNANWEEFEILFRKVNSDFYDRLNLLNSSLTPNERKLCVFLKLNMSNKDISQITFQSEEALKKARLRLRKKLELDPDINLATLIQNL